MSGIPSRTEGLRALEEEGWYDLWTGVGLGAVYKLLVYNPLVPPLFTLLRLVEVAIVGKVREFAVTDGVTNGRYESSFTVVKRRIVLPLFEGPVGVSSFG